LRLAAVSVALCGATSVKVALDISIFSPAQGQRSRQQQKWRGYSERVG
jgi:hypothetical protein